MLVDPDLDVDYTRSPFGLSGAGRLNQTCRLAVIGPCPSGVDRKTKTVLSM